MIPIAAIAGAGGEIIKLGIALQRQAEDDAQTLPRDSADRIEVERMNAETRALLAAHLAYRPRPDNPEVVGAGSGSTEPARAPTIEDVSGVVEDFTEGQTLRDYLEELRGGRRAGDEAQALPRQDNPEPE